MQRRGVCVCVCVLTVVRQLAVGLQTARLIQVVLQDDVGFVVLKNQTATFAFLTAETRVERLGV